MNVVLVCTFSSSPLTLLHLPLTFPLPAAGIRASVSQAFLVISTASSLIWPLELPLGSPLTLLSHLCKGQKWNLFFVPCISLGQLV